MSMLLILVPLSLLLVVVAVWAFMWAVGSGQFDDLETPAWDILTEAEPIAPSNTPATPAPTAASTAPPDQPS